MDCNALDKRRHNKEKVVLEIRTKYFERVKHLQRWLATRYKNMQFWSIKMKIRIIHALLVLKHSSSIPTYDVTLEAQMTFSNKRRAPGTLPTNSSGHWLTWLWSYIAKTGAVPDILAIDLQRKKSCSLQKRENGTRNVHERSVFNTGSSKGMSSGT